MKWKSPFLHRCLCNSLYANYSVRANFSDENQYQLLCHFSAGRVGDSWFGWNTNLSGDVRIIGTPRTCLLYLSTCLLWPILIFWHLHKECTKVPEIYSTAWIIISSARTPMRRFLWVGLYLLYRFASNLARLYCFRKTHYLLELRCMRRQRRCMCFIFSIMLFITCW